MHVSHTDGWRYWLRCLHSTPYGLSPELLGFLIRPYEIKEGENGNCKDLLWTCLESHPVLLP